MKKGFLLVALLCMVLQLSTVSAETFASHYPGGKNYLNPDNVEVNHPLLNSIDDIKVKANQIYTFSFPNRDLLGGNINVLIEGRETYIYEFAPGEKCIEESNMISCTFITSSDETNIRIDLESELIGLYYSYYGLADFQLEEGSVRTEYEDYIPPLIDGSGPEFQGSGAFITSYNSGLSTSEIIGSHIVAYDAIDGDITDQIVILGDQYTGNETLVGEYLIELYVCDSNGNETLFDLIILVKDEIVPELSGPDNIYLDVDKGLIMNTVIQDFITYSDDYDSNPSLSTIVDTYSGNETIVGSYEVTIQVVDFSGNQVTKDIIIHVEDVASPILHSDPSFDVDVSSPQLIADLIGLLEVSDNYDIEVDINVVNDQYTLNQSVIGTYFVDLELVDDYSNSTLITIMINVQDNQYPTMNGPIDITTSYTEKLSIEQIKSMYTVSDNYDVLSSSDISVLSDEYSAFYNIPGLYGITFALTDSSGNQTLHEVDIIVIDDVSPIIYVDEHIIIVDKGSTFTEEDMLNLLRLSQDINNQDYTVTILRDEYTGHEEELGDYIYKVQLTDETGQELIREFQISVVEDDSILLSQYKMPIIYTSIGIVVIIGAVIFRKYK